MEIISWREDFGVMTEEERLGGKRGLQCLRSNVLRVFLGVSNFICF